MKIYQVLPFAFSALTLVLASENHVKRTTEVLEKRQSDGILTQVPESCRSICTPVDIVLAGCTSVDCVCDEGNNVALKTCMDCLVDYSFGTSGYTQLRAQGETVLSNFARDCVRQGVSIRALVLNPTPPPGPPGSSVVTAIPSITTRSGEATSTRTSAGGNNGGNSDGNGNGSVEGLKLSLTSVLLLVAGGVVAVL